MQCKAQFQICILVFGKRIPFLMKEEMNNFITFKLHYVHFTVSSFVFHYFISYGKIVLQPISYAAKKKNACKKYLW